MQAQVLKVTANVRVRPSFSLRKSPHFGLHIDFRYLLCLLLTTAVGLLSLVAYNLNIGEVQEDIAMIEGKLAEYIQGGMARDQSPSTVRDSGSPAAALNQAST